MLDGVRARCDRRLAPIQPLGMRGDPEPHPVLLAGHGPKLGLRQLERAGILQLVGAGAGGHNLDEVRPGPDLLANRPPHIVRPVGFAVHVAVKPPAGRGGRDDLPAGQDARAAERAVTHRLPLRS